MPTTEILEIDEPKPVAGNEALLAVTGDLCQSSNEVCSRSQAEPKKMQTGRIDEDAVRRHRAYLSDVSLKYRIAGR